MYLYTLIYQYKYISMDIYGCVCIFMYLYTEMCSQKWNTYRNENFFIIISLKSYIHCSLWVVHYLQNIIPHPAVCRHIIKCIMDLTYIVYMYLYICECVFVERENIKSNYLYDWNNLIVNLTGIFRVDLISIEETFNSTMST